MDLVGEEGSPQWGELVLWCVLWGQKGLTHFGLFQKVTLQNWSFSSVGYFRGIPMSSCNTQKAEELS